MRPRASVVIPTFNGAQRLPRVLAALAAQNADDESFEVIVVDNASTDDTAKVALGERATRRLRDRGIELRVVGEARQGQTYARICGVKEAKSALICFLDDDNIPEREYIANGLKLFDAPAPGLIVSHIYAQWEIEPPPSIEKRQHLYAVNTYLGDASIDWGAVGTMVPTVTAGMWVRREAFLKAIPWDRTDLLVSGRVGGQLVGGEDIEIGVLIGKAGYHRGYAPSLRIAHEIPEWRLETRYVRRLIEAIVRGEMTLRMKYEGAKFGPYERGLAAMRLFVAVCAIPVFLVRRDGWRETVFVMADRWARLKGPIRSHASSEEGRPLTSPVVSHGLKGDDLA